MGHGTRGAVCAAQLVRSRTCGVRDDGDGGGVRVAAPVAVDGVVGADGGLDLDGNGADDGAGDALGVEVVGFVGGGGGGFG